jgi:DNA-binding FadR family transcriptional regulator
LVDAGGNIQVPVARSILRMRQVLSPEIAADAAVFGGATVADELDVLIAQMGGANDAAQLQQLALSYWGTLVEGSGNIAYRLAFNSLRKTYQHIWGLLTQMLAGEFSDTESFRSIAAAVRAGDRQAAFTSAKAYIDQNSAVLEQFLDAYERQARA